MKKRIFYILVCIIGLSLSGIVLAADDWTVSKIQPAYIGTEVVRESQSGSNPDATWVAPDDGLLQAVYHDHDPKCGFDSGYLIKRDEIGVVLHYVVPTAPTNSTCDNPIDNLWTSRVITVEQSNIIEGDMGQTSSYFYFDFATYTPSPIPTWTTTPSPTWTTTPSPTWTTTPSPTWTATATEVVKTVATPTPTLMVTVAPTPTPTKIVPQCMDVTLEQQDDGSYLIWVQAVNASSYIFSDGEGYLYFTEQPIVIPELVVGVVYTIQVGNDDIGCSFQIEPTSLPEIAQPVDRFVSRIPFVARP